MPQFVAVFGSCRKLHRCFLALGLSMVFHLSASEMLRAEENLILVADDPGMPGGLIGIGLQKFLMPEFSFQIEKTDGDKDVFQWVLASSSNVGVGHADVFGEFIKESSQGAKLLEFHGSIPACLLLVVSRASAIQTFDDFTTRLRTTDANAIATIDVGPAQASAAATFSVLRNLVPEFKGARIEHSGGFRALSRVASGQIDAAAMMVHAPFSEARISALIRSDKIKVLPIYSHALGKLFNMPKSPYQAQEIRLSEGNWFGASESVLTTCTSLGVVANTAVDGKISEALAKITLNGDFYNQGSTFGSNVTQSIENAKQGLRDTGEWIEGVVSGVLDAGLKMAGPNTDPDKPAVVLPSSTQNVKPIVKGLLTMPVIEK